MWRHEYWTSAVPYAFWPTNNDTYDSWWDKYWKIICAHNFDLKIVIKKVVCQKKKSGHFIMTILLLIRVCVCVSLLGLGSKFNHDALPPLLPYLLNLPQCDLFLFLKCEIIMRVQHWDDVDSIKREMTRQLKSLTSQNTEGCFEQWKQRIDMCIETNGEYFERDKIDVVGFVWNKKVILLVHVFFEQTTYTYCPTFFSRDQYWRVRKNNLFSDFAFKFLVILSVRESNGRQPLSLIKFLISPP